MASVKSSRKLSGWQYSAGRAAPFKADVAIEQEFPIFVNGKQLVIPSITPNLLKEFAMGYLFGQGIINSLEEVASLEILNNTAHVTLKDRRKTLTDAAKTNYRIVSGGGKSIYFPEADLSEIKSDLVISKRTLFSAMNQLFKNALLYSETEGVHATGLFNTRASPVCIVEDIGRHNTLDKIIGYTLLHKIDCSRLFLVSTGRMASEMVTKICRSGIPVVATRTAVTNKGLETAKKCGLTIAGFVRTIGSKAITDASARTPKKNSMKIYCGAERVRSA
ncbi:MAG: formate dehydrogenase accessory sulfurtransferase FdhD [Dehalococcoidales bacterium]|nr:formate dehydrogenase accessory sulfurtransferase FdhD [Dehalococcoidales bacterium]